VVVVLGVVIAAVPAGFTMFPPTGPGYFGQRVITFIAWVVALLVAVALATLGDDALRQLVSDELGIARADALRAERRAAVSDQFRALLVPGVGGLPATYMLTVYAPSSDGRYLIPVHPPALNAADTAIFPAGTGATGVAWESGDSIAVFGAAVSDDTYDLTPAQRRRYARFEAVAATVIRGGDDGPQGVLTAITDQDDAFFADEEGMRVLQDVASGLTWLMPAALQWMMPNEGQPT
jgi:hypothetical protein